MDKSNDDNKLQSSNMDSILVTFCGLKLDKSIDDNEIQPYNIYCILFNFENKN